MLYAHHRPHGRVAPRGHGRSGSAAQGGPGGPAQEVNSRGGQVPQVFLDYDQDELDRAYDQRVWAPNRDHVIKRNGLASEAVRAWIG